MAGELTLSQESFLAFCETGLCLLLQERWTNGQVGNGL